MILFKKDPTKEQRKLEKKQQKLEKKAARALCALQMAKGAAGEGGASVRNSEVTVDASAMEAGGRWVVETAMATHIGTRDYQQDAAYVSESSDEGFAFAILCDGMGGMEAGELVSSDVVEFLANRMTELAEDDDIPEFYERAIVEANELIHQRYVRNGKEGGTTLVSTIIRDGGLYWASVGDSRIYIMRDGEIAQLTRDHNYALQLQQMVERGRISQQEADSDPQREALVSYIGAPVLDVVDVARSHFELIPGDIVLLCSDGLTKSLSNARILALLQEYWGNLAQTARVLPVAAFDESPGGQDNTSVILLQYNGTAEQTAQCIGTVESLEELDILIKE